MHGDEESGVEVAERLFPLLSSVLMVARVNPDGLHRGQRQNANGVDLNRNFPTRDWMTSEPGRYHGGSAPASEPETGALLELLKTNPPQRVLTLHADLHNVNYDGPAQEWAQGIAKRCGYELAPDIGYPTPGSFGTYLGKERGIPTVTFELPPGTGEEHWPVVADALLWALG